MTNQTKLSRFIKDALDEQLGDHKFKLSFQEYQAENVGNELLEYEFDHFLLFVTKDRERVSVDLAPKNFPGEQVSLIVINHQDARLGRGTLMHFVFSR